MKNNNQSIDNLMRKLKTEKVKGGNLTVKIFTNFSEDQLIVRLKTDKHLIERTFSNTKHGKFLSEKFIEKFKNGKDLERYFNKKGDL